MNGHNKHSETFKLGDWVIHIDGIPDDCEHEWEGETVYIDSEGGIYRESEISDPLRTINFVGAAVTCSKCRKIFEPDLFMDENPES